jgi:hypothetical protein
LQVLQFNSAFAVWRSVHFYGHLAIAGAPFAPDVSSLRSLDACCIPGAAAGKLCQLIAFVSQFAPPDTAAITMYAVVFPPKRPSKPVQPAGTGVDQADGAVAAHGSKEE